MPAAYLQRPQGYKSLFIGCSGHMESIQIIGDKKSKIKKSKFGPTWPQNLYANYMK